MKKYLKKNVLTALVLFSALLGFSEEGKIFRFKHSKGDDYRILSTVKEDVKVNRRFDHRAEILNRVHVSVTDVDEKGRGLHEGTFMTSEQSVGVFGGKFSWGEEYDSKFWRDSSGKYEITDEYFMPIVRDVPYFPETPVKIGDTWTGEGYEAHDLKALLDMTTPFKIPFSVQYTYLQDEVVNGKKYSVIGARYNLYYETPAPKNRKAVYPVATMGYSNQTIFWDDERGQIDHYTEDFRIVMEISTGDTFDFSGIAHAEVTEFERVATDENLKLMQEKVEELGLENVSVSKSDKGLTISIENIQFKPDSAILEFSEKLKLEMIAKILEAYPNDILVAGHTARAGSEQSCQELSEERADSVANYLVGLGVRDKYHIMTIGYGSKQPIAPNSNNAGMARNRRVEITILDK